MDLDQESLGGMQPPLSKAARRSKTNSRDHNVRKQATGQIGCRLPRREIAPLDRFCHDATLTRADLARALFQGLGDALKDSHDFASAALTSFEAPSISSEQKAGILRSLVRKALLGVNSLDAAANDTESHQLATFTPENAELAYDEHEIGRMLDFDS